MGSEWQHTTLGECLNQEGGSILTGPFGTLLKAAEYTSTGVPVISVSEVGFGSIELKSHTPRVDHTITERLPKYLLREDDIVFARKGAGTAVERSALVKADQQGWFLGSDGIRVRLPRSIDARYVSYWLQSKQHRNWMKQHAVGTTMPALNEGIVKRIPVSLPPLSEQKRIAHILGTLDEKIELNRRMNATLEAMARALFQSWFVDFDPVRAKMDGRKPEGMDDATSSIFPDGFQQSSLGQIPNGWEVCPLSKKIQLFSGGTPQTSEPTYWGGDVPWYSVRDAPSETDVWVTHTDKRITQLGVANSAAQVLPEKTTIISARGTVGKVALTAMPMAMNQSCYGVRGVAGYSACFTYYAIREAASKLQQRTHGTVFDTITTDTFNTLECIFPPSKTTAAFEHRVEPLLGQICANLYQARIVSTMRDALLPKMIKSELLISRPT
jgi:type I restriction enzyme, S subunit